MPLIDPTSLAQFFLEHVIAFASFDKDLEATPPVDRFTRLGATEQDRRRTANEEVLLRGLACVLYVNKHAEAEYAEKFTDLIIEAIEPRMKASCPPSDDPDVRNGLNKYVEDFASEHPPIEFSRRYLNRVFRDELVIASLFHSANLPLHYFKGVSDWYGTADRCLTIQFAENVLTGRPVDKKST